jgi:hypothetical protein
MESLSWAVLIASLSAVLGLILNLLGLWNRAARLWSSTEITRRREAENILKRLVPGTPIDVFETLLGKPTFVNPSEIGKREFVFVSRFFFLAGGCGQYRYGSVSFGDNQAG